MKKSLLVLCLLALITPSTCARGSGGGDAPNTPIATVPSDAVVPVIKLEMVDGKLFVHPPKEQEVLLDIHADGHTVIHKGGMVELDGIVTEGLVTNTHGDPLWQQAILAVVLTIVLVPFVFLYAPWAVIGKKTGFKVLVKWEKRIKQIQEQFPNACAWFSPLTVGVTFLTFTTTFHLASILMPLFAFALLGFLLSRDDLMDRVTEPLVAPVSPDDTVNTGTEAVTPKPATSAEKSSSSSEKSPTSPDESQQIQDEEGQEEEVKEEPVNS